MNDGQKKRRKSKTSNERAYFNAGTKDAILKFQIETDRKVRERIYVDSIMPAFVKLVENLINIYRFSGLHDTFDELKNDCVNFLFETIHKYDPQKGPNAFSYFNVVAKNWLIIRTKEKSKKSKRNVSLDDPSGLSSSDVKLIDERNIVVPPDETIDASQKNYEMLGLLSVIRSQVQTENELICINAIITIFENVDNLDLFNKRAMKLYMKELSGLNSKQLMIAMQNIKKLYRQSKAQDERDDE